MESIIRERVNTRKSDSLEDKIKKYLDKPDVIDKLAAKVKEKVK